MTEAEVQTLARRIYDCGVVSIDHRIVIGGMYPNPAEIEALAAAYLQACADRDDAVRLQCEILGNYIELEEIGNRLLGKGQSLQAQMDALQVAIRHRKET